MDKKGKPSSQSCPKVQIRVDSGVLAAAANTAIFFSSFHEIGAT